MRNQRYAMWKDEINCLGNLVILEQAINRSIQNIPFNKKKKEYAKSKYEAVKEICSYSDWYEKIFSYLLIYFQNLWYNI